MGDYLLLIIFWNWGEPFLNPQAIDMIRYATDRGILVHSSTNGNMMFSDEMAEKLVRSNLTSLIVAIDGANQETYAKYRIGGRLENVKKTIRIIQETKKRLNSQFPRVTVRFVAMHQNEEERNQVEALAKELGADYFATKSVDMPVARGEHLDEVYAPEEESFKRYEYISGTFERKPQPFKCMRPWKRVTLESSGKLISCEYDYKNLHTFGSITGQDSVKDIWKSKTSQEFRGNFNLGHNEYYHCKVCTYKDLVGQDCILEAHPIK
jgi:radical SAM protein with 4Fe4S-binding SPASM domain